MPRINFTAASVAAIKPTARRVDYWDVHLTGFGLRVTTAGIKTWFLWFRLNGRSPARWTIGRYPALSLADARDIARVAIGKMAAAPSFDPRVAKIEARVSATVADLAADYIRLHARPNKKSWKKDQGRIDRFVLPAWRHRLVRDVKRQDVQRLIDDVADPEGRNTPQAAVNLRRMLSRMFSWALARDFGIEYSPVQGTKPPAKNSRRKRYLLDVEIAALLSAVSTLRATGHRKVAEWLVLILLTAQRPGEIIGMKWDQIEYDGRVGWLNLRTSKNGDPVNAALSPQAIKVLAALRVWSVADAARQGRALSRFVFPGQRIDAPMWTNKIPQTYGRAHKLMGVSDWTPHDLRRTARTLMAKLGVPKSIAERVQNHSDGSVDAVYDRFDYRTERMDAVPKLGAHVAKLGRTKLFRVA